MILWLYQWNGLFYIINIRFNSNNRSTFFRKLLIIDSWSIAFNSSEYLNHNFSNVILILNIYKIKSICLSFSLLDLLM
jgi:hypothetical protein